MTAQALSRPPSSSEGRRAGHADDGLPVADEGDERRPDRNSPDVVLGGVDGIDDPGPSAVQIPAELLADDLVVRPQLADQVAQEDLDGAVGLGDRGQVRLVSTTRSLAR